MSGSNNFSLVSEDEKGMVIGKEVVGLVQVGEQYLSRVECFFAKESDVEEIKERPRYDDFVGKGLDFFNKHFSDRSDEKKIINLRRVLLEGFQGRNKKYKEIASDFGINVKTFCCICSERGLSRRDLLSFINTSVE